MVVRPDSPNPESEFPVEDPQQSSGPTIDEAFRDLCAQIHDRLGRIEASLQRTEGFVADKPWDVSTLAYKRLERVEETLRIIQRSLDDSTLPEMCVNIERQITQTRMATQRTEEAVADTSLRELCKNIDARLVRTEDRLRRTEGSVAGWLQDFSTSIAARLATADEAMRRIERIVSNRTAEETSSQQPLHALPVRAEVNRHGLPLPWMAGLAVTALVLITAANGVLFWTSRSASRAQVAAAPVTTPRAETLPAQAAAAPLLETPISTVAATAPAPRVKEPVAAPARPAASRQAVAIAAEPRTFVGTLSITSVPSGARVLINGRAAGVTPLRLSRQRAGSLAVQVAQEGFERWSAAVRVPADQLTQVTARLRPLVQ
jgi:hypothetical protein